MNSQLDTAFDEKFSLQSDNKELTCGVIGGLGPEATIHFLQLILEKTQQLFEVKDD